MTAVEERLAFLEGRVTEHAQQIEGIREAIVSLERRLDARFEAIDRRFEAIDRRFEAIDRRFEVIDRRFEVIDRRLEAIDQKFTLLDGKIDNRFLWLVGTQVTTLVAIAAALVAR
jgi:chromosome segregation ATPase